MNKSRIIGTLSAVLFTFITVSANASLVGRLPSTPGGTDYQAAYDTVLDITWLTDADLSGDNTWDNQLTWIGILNTANHLGFNDWRLASMSVAAGLPTGTTTSVFNCSTSPSTTELACRDNELGYMFYHNMGGALSDNKTGNQTVNGVLLTDVQSLYWSGTEFDSDFAWSFRFGGGDQSGGGLKGLSGHYGWAVRAGDVSAVPVPAAVWLFGSGLLGLIGAAQRKKA